MEDRKRAASLVTGSWLAAAIAAPAMAQSSSPAQGLLDNAFTLNVSAYLVDSAVNASLNGQSATNPEIDFDESFGRARDSVRARLDARWRLSPRHQLRLMYFDYSNRRTATLEDDVAWGDHLFPAGSSAQVKTEFRVGALAYEYAFVREPRYQVAATVGVHATDIKLAINGTAAVPNVGGNGARTDSVTETAKGIALLPLIGVRGAWVPSPQWYLEASGEVFSLRSGDYRGSWSELRLSGTWMFARNVGIGLGYGRFASRYDTSRQDFDGRLRHSYSGLQAFLAGTF